MNRYVGTSTGGWAATVLLTALCLGGVLLVLYAVLPLDAYAARYRWQHQQPAHYELKARWRSGGWVSYSRLEVRDEQIVSGTDMFTGAALSPVELGVQRSMFPVTQTFAQVEQLEQWPPSWHAALARLMPLPALRRAIDSCAVPAPRVRYDPQLGFPAEVHAYSNPCYNGVGFDLAIEAVQPLP